MAVEGEDGSLTVGRQALRDALNDSIYRVMIGTIDCDEFGDCGSQEIQIVTHPDPSVTDATQLEVVYTFSGVEEGS